MIAGVLDALERCIDLVERGDTHPREDMARFAVFLKEFVQLVHYEKEESILLPALAHSGMSWDSGTLGDTHADHRMECHLIESFDAARPRVARWSAHHRRRLAGVGRSLITLLRDHMAREERSLFPAIGQRLRAGAYSDLAGSLWRFDQAREADGHVETMRQLARSLLDEYPPQSDDRDL